MVTLMPAFATLMVSFVYCAYEHARQAETHRRRVVRERVAELLWAAAQHGR